MESLPLYHFYPGAQVLCLERLKSPVANESGSFARNLAHFSPMLHGHGVKALAFRERQPWNRDILAGEMLAAFRQSGLRTIALTTGTMPAERRMAYFQNIDAVSLDLKAFTDAFYVQQTGAQLSQVLETLLHLYHETGCWLEIRTGLILGVNDHPIELDAMTQWLYKHLGHEVPLHFSLRNTVGMTNRFSPGSVSLLQKARKIAQGNGLSHVYVDHPDCPDGRHTHCECCGYRVIRRGVGHSPAMDLTERFECPECGMKIKGKIRHVLFKATAISEQGLRQKIDYFSFQNQDIDQNNALTGLV